MRFRERQSEMTDSSVVVGQQWYDFVPPYGNGPWVSPYTYRKYYYGSHYHNREQTWDELHPGPPYKKGGPFDTIKYSTDQYVIKGNCTAIYGMKKYTGGFLPNIFPSSYLDYSNPADAKAADWGGDLADKGAKAWNRFRPTRSDAEMGVFLGEIREVPRMLKTTAKGFRDVWKSMGGSVSGFGPKSVANHWLNTQFGWFPFLADLQAFHKATVNLDARMKQLRKDNNQWIKRGGTLERTTDVEVVVEDLVTGHTPTLSTTLYSQTPYGTRRVIRDYVQRIWFEGRFKYWIPSLGKSPWNVRELAHIYGFMPSPALVWNLTPWSWLIDWCSDAGDAIANLSSIAFDNLCAKYAYLMCSTAQRCILTASSFLQPPAGTVTTSWFAELERKQRLEASPFGFGLDGFDFTTRQWSILSALGITRLR